MTMRWMMWLAALALPVPALAMEVHEVQGGCEPSLLRKQVLHASAKLERCGATGQVILHVGPDGRVERVSADVDAKSCLGARTADWKIKMKEKTRCTVMLVTAGAKAQLQANLEAQQHAHPLPKYAKTSAPAPRPAQLPVPLATKDNVPEVVEVEPTVPQPTDEVKPSQHGSKAEARAAAVAAKKAALAARKAKLAAARAAKLEKRKAAQAARKSAKHKEKADNPKHKHGKHAKAEP